jgi:signal transduction histidine kinase
MATIESGLAAPGAPAERAPAPPVAWLRTTILAARWLAWLLALAFMASGVADDVTGSESVFLLVALAQNTAATYITLRGFPASGRSSAATDPLLVLSVIDMTLAMLAVYFTGGTDSPFYLFAVSTLLTPASALGFTGMLLVTGMFVGGYVLALSTTDADLHAPQEGAGPRSFAVFLAVPFALAMLVQLLAATARRLEREEARLAEALEENLRLQPLRDELATQRERDRIARELHDGLSQSVYMLSLNLEATADLVRDNARVRSRLETLVALARHILLEVRQYIFDLRPLLEEKEGVSEALQSQASEFSAVSGLPVSVQISGDEGQLPLAQRAALYRISQEALANVYRHSHASRAVVTVSFAPDEVILEVTDDGTGVAGEADSGTGLRGIRERAAALAGSAEVGFAPGRGTSVRAILPRTNT